MTKKFRDFLFIVFIVLFVSGTIVLSLYASGYKFNLAWPIDFNRLLVKTGVIAIDSNPRGAIIYLDGKAEPVNSWKPWQKKYLTTPAKIKNLLPGDYELMIEREGYWPFKVSLKVESGLTTFYEHISLFKADNPTIKSIGDDSLEEESIFLSPNNDFLYLSNSFKIITLENDLERNILKNGKDEIKINNELKDTSFSWQKNNELLFGGVFFNPTGEEKDRNFSALIGENSYDYKLEESSNKLFYKIGDNLSYFDLNLKSSEVILRDISLGDYLPKNKTIIIISEDNGNKILQEYSLETKKLVQELSLPSDGEYLFQEERDIYLSVYDKKNKSLYLIEQNNFEKGLRKIEAVNSWAWDSNDGFFFVNDWELQYFNIKENRFYLFSRLGDELKNILINEKNKYLILAGEKKIMVYDLRTSHITTILEAEKISSPVLDKNKDLLYFWGKLNDQQGVYRISVR